MALLSMSSRSLVGRAPAMCSGGLGLDSCRGLGFFLCRVPTQSMDSLFILRALKVNLIDMGGFEENDFRTVVPLFNFQD